MKLLVFITSVMLLMISINAQANTSSLIKDPESCFRGQFSSYETWRAFWFKKKPSLTIEQFSRWHSREEFDRKKKKLSCIDFVYEVDGINVGGYYLMPKPSVVKSLPVVIYNRGGNGAYGNVNFDKQIGFIADLAMKGYLVIGSQYRGASNYIDNNGEDEFGGKDVDDVVKLSDIIASIPEANTTQIAMLGWSRGASQSYQSALKMPQLKALIAIAGNSDAEKSLVWRPKMISVYNKRIPNFESNRASELEKRSVIKWMNKLPSNLPILLLHGDQDKRVNVEQSIAFAKSLEESSHPFKLVIYENGNHSLTGHKKEYREEVFQWLAMHLK